LVKALAGAGPLKLIQRKNIADYTEKLQEHLATLKNATGLEFGNYLKM